MAGEGAGGSAGTTIAGRYALVERLGGGAAGEVFRARWAAVEREVVLRLIAPPAGGAEGFARRFDRMAAAAARLAHPNAVQVLDFGRAPEGLYLVTELVPGETLAQRLATAGPFAPPRVCGIGRQVLGALAEAHVLGLVHGGLRPANVRLDPTRTRPGFGDDFARVLDVGLGVLVAGGAGDPRADLRAAGALLHELLVGTPPGPGAAGELPPELAVPPALARLVADALSADPARLPASADAMRAVLAGVG